MAGAQLQQQQELLIAELNHRVRNILNLIRGLINQSKHDAPDIDTFAQIVGGRISSLASAHDNITKGNWSHAPFSELIETEANAYLTGKKDRLDPASYRPIAVGHPRARLADEMRMMRVEPDLMIYAGEERRRDKKIYY